jgi:diguanylate cyclase (GGDEF)-like protein
MRGRPTGTLPTLLLAALFLFRGTPLLALDPSRLMTQYLRDTWQTEQGLPQNSVGAIQRTRDGYLWVGTEEGLARFDGAHFTVFDRRNTPELTSGNVNVLFEDRSGTLWVGTSRGLTRYARGKFERVGSGDLRIASIHQSSDGAIWIGTLGDGLYQLTAGGSSLQPVVGKFPGKRVRAVTSDSAGTLWLATEAGLVARRGSELRLFNKSDGLLDDNLFALVSDRDGTLWIGSEAGVQSLRNGRFTTLATPAEVSLERVRAMGRDRAMNLWIGTQGHGLARLRPDGHIEALSAAQGISSDVVNALAEDVEDNLWIGTSGGGLIRLRDGKVATFSTSEGLPADLVFSIFEDRDRAMWFGTRGGGVSRLKDGRMSVWATKEGMTSDDVISVAQTSDGTMWFGTYGGGLVRLRDDKITGTLRQRDGLSSDIVYALLAGRDGSLWIGTGGAGLNRLHNGKVTRFDEANGLRGTFVQTLLEDSNGALWIGTNEGLARLQNGALTSWTTADGLPDKSVIALAMDGDALWIGTPGGGMARFKAGHFDTVTMRDGLHDDMVAAILDDGRGRFWCSSNHGLFSMARSDLNAVADGRQDRLTSAVYGAADGMRSAECYGGSYPSSWRGRDGRLWFATIRGAVAVDAAHLVASRFHPPVVIESITADGRDIGASGELAAGTKRIEIAYSGLSLRDPARLTFRYVLEGFDPQWIDGGTRRVAYFTNVPHGRYRFHVTARDGDGVSSTNEAVRTFEVLPHLWETWWFRLLMGLALLSLILAAHRLRVWRLQARQRELERVVELRTHELNEANRELDRLARVDGLTGIANRRAFDEALQKAWADARRHDLPLSVVLCDIDQFKKFNDSQGHQAGDETLRAVAQAVAGALRRETDLAARYGGEELVLLLPDTDAAQAFVVAQSALERVRALAIPHPASDVTPNVTLSLGIAAARPAEGGAAAELVLKADEALYRAKTSGRNRCVAA